MWESKSSPEKFQHTIGAKINKRIDSLRRAKRAVSLYLCHSPHLPPLQPSCSQLPECPPADWECEPLQMTREHVQKASLTLQDLENTHKWALAFQGTALGKTNRKLTALSLDFQDQEKAYNFNTTRYPPPPFHKKKQEGWKKNPCDYTGLTPIVKIISLAQDP